MLRAAVCVGAAVVVARAQEGSPFASRVVSYDPAPGQFVNNANFNDPARALGSPVGGGISTPDNTSVVTLGGFGGSITLAFDHTVLDEPLNPYGLDAVVFGNAFFPGGDVQAHWSEAATIEISRDENENGLADDAWYLIPGSHITLEGDSLLVVIWDDDVGDSTYGPELSSWLPPGVSGVWSTSAFDLPLDVFGGPLVRNPSPEPAVEGIFGYAEYAPTLVLGDLDADGLIDDATMSPEEFYTVPDDPLAVGMTPGSGGGDAFDIAWALDPTTGAPADLTGFDFVRITSAVAVFSGPVGEVSAEIDAVSDVRADPFGDADDDGDIDLTDVAVLQRCFGQKTSYACDRFDREPNGTVELTDAAALVARITGPKP